MDFTGSWSHWTRVGGDRTGHPSSSVWQRDPQQIQTPHCPFVRDFRCVPAPECLCTLQLLLLKHSSILPSFRAGVGSPEVFLQPWQGRGAAALEHVQLRPCSKPNSLIKNAWPQDSAAFWQPGRGKMVIQQLLHSCALVQPGQVQENKP